MKLPAPLRTLRPQQWSKNLFVLAAAAFALGDVGLDVPREALVNVALAFSAFCLTASSIYVLNDILDREGDREHPEKRFRPIAAGEIAVGTAAALGVACAIGGLALAWQAGVFPILLAYAINNVFYSKWLKHMVLVDVFSIAAGFLLRVLAGGQAAGIGLSHWLLLCTLLLALFLACAKRRSELALLGADAAKHRLALAGYSLPFVDQLVTLFAAATVLSYALWTIDPETVAKFEGTGLFWSVPSVIFGIGRYLHLMHTSSLGGTPTKVLLGADRAFLVNLLLWAAVVGGVLTGKF